MRRFELLLAGWMVLCAASAASEVVLIPTAEGIYRPGDAIEFELIGVPQEQAERLSLSIDGVDVTRFVSSDGVHARLELPHPLEAGERELRLVEIRDDGAILELGRWLAVVQPASGISEAELSVDLSGELHRRIADEDLDAPAFGETPQRTLLQGAALIDGRVAGEDWSAELYAPILFRRDRQTQSGQPWDMADGWLRMRRGRFHGEVGHLTPGPSSLVNEGLHRRGAAAHVDFPEVGSRLTAFSVRANPISGFEEGIGLSDRNRRISGVMATGRPFEREWGSLSLAATYLRGRNGDGGSGISDEFASNVGGTAWSAVADGEIYQGRARLRGEYARTHLDRNFDGPGHADRDDAFSVWLQVVPLRDARLLDLPLELSLVGSLEEVGSKFGSPANLFVTTDRRRARYEGHLSWGGFSTNVTFTRDRYNHEGREEDPTWRNDAFYSAARYQFLDDPDDWIPNWAGSPFIEAEWSRSRLKPISTPDPTGALDDLFGGFTAPVYSDESQRMGGLTIGSSYGIIDWSLSHAIGRIEDRTRLSADIRTDLSTLSLSWQPSSRRSISFSLQRDREKLEDTGSGTTTWTGALSLYEELLPNRLELFGSLGVTQTHGSNEQIDADEGFGLGIGSALDQRSIVISGSLTWKAIEARPQKPGVTFVLDTVWERYEDDKTHSLTRDSWQTFLKVRVDWPLRWQKGA